MIKHLQKLNFALLILLVQTAPIQARMAEGYDPENSTYILALVASLILFLMLLSIRRRLLIKNDR